MGALRSIIDVWDVRTFDSGLLRELGASANLVCCYFETEIRIFHSYDLGRGSDPSILRPNNPHSHDFSEFLSTIDSRMRERTIRAFHYTRLTDDEVDDLLQHGIHVSTPETLRERLDAVVASGGLTRDIADQIYAGSPFHSSQLQARSEKFWMVSHPTAVDDGGVAPLMQHWGGEVASMWIRKAPLSAPLLKLGRPRIIEVAVPIAATKHSHVAAKAVVASYARSRGEIPDKSAFDLYVESALPPTAVIAVRTAGDGVFEAMGRNYPAGFTDVAVGRWKELTGEDE